MCARRNCSASTGTQQFWTAVCQWRLSLFLLLVDQFRLDRISKAGGEIAQQVTKGVRSQLDKKIAEKEQKLVKKINKQLAEKQDQLRLSIADAAKSKWTKAADKFLPSSVQQALSK